jgi:hypothetical protein
MHLSETEGTMVTEKWRADVIECIVESCEIVRKNKESIEHGCSSTNYWASEHYREHTWYGV